MTIRTFQRYENKYLISEEQYKEVVIVLSKYMIPDKHSQNGGSYTIYNIYYDTENNDIIRHSISKPYYKEKLRLRSYNIPKSQDDKVFLEIKKKIGGVVSKRRATISFCDAVKFIETGVPPNNKEYLNTQVIREISNFLTIHDVSAKVFIRYDRVAFFGTNDKNFRVTFDSNIITRRHDVALENGGVGVPLLDANQYIMEIKICGGMPLWLTHLLAAQHIYSTGFSKYGREYKKFCVYNNNET